MFTFLQTRVFWVLSTLMTARWLPDHPSAEKHKLQVVSTTYAEGQLQLEIMWPWIEGNERMVRLALQWISSINIENTRLITTITSRGCDVFKKTSKGFVWQTLWCLHRTRIPFIALYLKPMLHSPASSRAPSVFQLDRFVSTMGASSGWRDACSNESVCF